MIRLLVLLCVGMFATLMIAGEDHGQKRYGLMLADAATAKAATAVAAPPDEPQVQTVFVPAQPVIQPIEAAVQTAVATADPAPTQVPMTEAVSFDPTQTLPAPEIPGGKLFAVAASGANVRQGPGTGFAVLDSLASGEQVLVVEDGAVLEGWSKVRLEGDGVEGYIASRLLVAAE